MRIYDNYIIILTGLLLATAVIFAFLEETHLDLCFSVFLIETLILNELCIYLNPRAKKGLNTVNYMLFAGFALIMADKIVKIIWGFSTLEIIWSIARIKAAGILGL
ncbi:MAG: hypothetical protein J7K94_00950 [Dehalococcoidia bacterium]|nr:hypothetical protein [Dehalococcoidia bacterium]